MMAHSSRVRKVKALFLLLDILLLSGALLISMTLHRKKEYWLSLVTLLNKSKALRRRERENGERGRDRESTLATLCLTNKFKIIQVTLFCKPYIHPGDPVCVLIVVLYHSLSKSNFVAVLPKSPYKSNQNKPIKNLQEKFCRGQTKTSSEESPVTLKKLRVDAEVESSSRSPLPQSSTIASL